jgi:hypothetical protein
MLGRLIMPVLARNLLIKKYYFVAWCGDCGEVEGMFDEKENLVATWCSNDATWRQEYFADFMKVIGVEIVEARGELYKRLGQKLEDHWGYDEPDEMED